MGVVTDVLLAAYSHVPTMPNSELVKHEWTMVCNDAMQVYDVLTESRLFFYTLCLATAYFLYWLLFSKLMYYRRNHEVGYITSQRQSKVERANEVRRRRQRGDLPPVYPNGWYRLCEAHDLKNGDVKQMHLLGLDLAVFRTESGKAACVSAYCTHLGANIAAGGTVDGENIECPFHGWQFDGEGKCKSIPYSSARIPEQAHLSNYEILEINDTILFWFDAEGRDAMWYPPELPQVNTSWSFRGISQHYINSHIQEVPENAADVAHLNYLHGPGLLSGTDLRDTHDKKFEFLKHEWYASWAPETDEDKKHLSVLKLTHRLKMFGMFIPMLDLHVTATQVGPGLVYLTWNSFFGEGVFMQALTPQEPLYQELTHSIYASSTVPQIIAKFYLFGEAKQVERDVMVWNNKMYRKNPVLIKEDALIGKHRRWYSQFYSENSPTYESVMKSKMDW
eukprot:m.64040 g.64040  ORF g.64040 m.64040 type:complete len:449 (+) comp13992_c0_seq1:136-1482(+)